MHHFALKIGDSLQELATVKRDLDAAGVSVHMAMDHRISQGLYVSDPDGTLIKLYVDAGDELWQHDPSVVANSGPLML